MTHLRFTAPIACSLKYLFCAMGKLVFRTHLRFSPPSVTSCCNPSCSPVTYSLRWESSSTFQISSSLNLSNGSRFILSVPENKTGSCNHEVRRVSAPFKTEFCLFPFRFMRTCGMIVSRFLRSCRPIVEMSMSSMRMRPSAASIILNRQLVRLDFPAPVRPTIPI